MARYSKSAGKDVKSAMHRRKKGTLKSGPGGKGGTVKSRKQAIATIIAGAALGTLVTISSIGAGAVGGFYGALLAKAGHDVSFVARGAHRDAAAGMQVG